MPTPTSSSSTTYINPPLDIATLTAQAIQDRLTQADAALVARQANIDAETTRATLAENAEVATRAAAIIAEATVRLTADNTENAARTAADIALTASINSEALARINAIAVEVLARQTGEASIQAQLARVIAVASASAYPGTQLTRPALAATITSISGNGTTTTLDTAPLVHGFTTGDELKVTGTTNYNVLTGAITVLSTTRFTYASAVNAATETSGTVATIGLLVAATSNFVAGQYVAMPNDAGQFHVTTVNGSPSGGVVRLTAPVPTSWRGATKASTGTFLSATPPDIALALTSIPTGNGYGVKGLPELAQILNANLVHPRTYGAVANDPTVDNTAALNAALAVTGGVVLIDANTTYYLAGTLTPGSNARICGMGATSVLQKPSANAVGILVDNVSNVDIANLMIDGTALISGGGAEADHVGVRVQNSQNVNVRNVTAKRLTSGIVYRMYDIDTGNPATRTISPVPSVFGVDQGEISGCTATDCKDFGIVLFRQCRHIRILNNTASRCGSMGICLDDGTTGDEAARSLDHPTGFGQPITNCTVLANICCDNTTAGLQVAGTQNSTFTANICEYNGVYKDLVADPTGNIGYAGVLRNGLGFELMNVQNHQPCRFNTVTGNVCSNNRRVGMTLLGADFNVLDANVCVDNGNDWMSSPPAAGIWLLESGSYNIAAITAGYQSALTAVAAAGATTLTVASTATGAAVGQGVFVPLTDGTYHGTRITNVVSATQLTVDVAIPTGKSAAIGAVVAQPAVYGTTLSAGVVAGNTSMPVFQSNGAATGMAVRMLLDNGAVHSTTIASIADSTHVTLAAAIPTGRSAAAGTALGQILVSFATDPTVAGAGGPVFTATSNVGYSVVKNRQANVNERNTEYATLTAVSSGAKTITLTTPPTRPIPHSGNMWNPYGASYNQLTNNVLVRTQAGRQPNGVRINDNQCVGNVVRGNKPIDFTGNSEYNWIPIVDGNTSSPATMLGNNTIDQLAHSGTATLNGGSPPSVTVTTNALLPSSEIRLSRKTAATTPANTGVAYVYSRTDAAYAINLGTILNAAAASGATSISVLNANGIAIGSTIAIILTNGSVHTTTVTGAYAGGTTVPLTAALPSAAALDNGVTVTVPAVAGSFVIRSTVNGDDGTVMWNISS